MIDLDKRKWLIVAEWDSCDSRCNTQEYMNYTIKEAVEDVYLDIPEHDEAEMTIFVNDITVAVANGNIEGYDIAPIK